MLDRDYLASIVLANPQQDAAVNASHPRVEVFMAQALTGPCPITLAQEEEMISWIKNGQINPSLRLNARIMHMDQTATPPMGTLWSSYDGCKLSHLLLAFAKRSPRTMQAFIDHFIDPNNLEFFPFWYRSDGVMLPGRYAENETNQYKHFRDVQEVASDVCWPLLIKDPRINLAASHGLIQTIADRYVTPFIIHVGFMGHEHADQLLHFPRLMFLLAQQAPLYMYADNVLLKDWMSTRSQADLAHFHHMQKDDDNQWITPIVFRQWSLGGHLPEVLASDYWAGKEEKALLLALSLPEQEQYPITSEIIRLQLQCGADRSHSRWTDAVRTQARQEIVR